MRPRRPTVTEVAQELAGAFQREMILASEFRYRQTMFCEWRREWPDMDLEGPYQEMWRKIALAAFQRLRRRPRPERVAEEFMDDE